MLCVIWYQLYNLKNMKNTHRGILLLEKVTFVHGCFHVFLIAQMVPNHATHRMLSFKLYINLVCKSLAIIFLGKCSWRGVFAAASFIKNKNNTSQTKNNLQNCVETVSLMSIFIVFLSQKTTQM